MGALHGVIYVTGVHTQHTARKIGHIALCVKVEILVATIRTGMERVVQIIAEV